ncbi:galactosylgalactosylxylosylprotein 3-beta-glucuronosyltransferase P-like [Eriocheir sinensis]|uniref:galactosylgalactosylxylosylprotein 3-beta-glucuronosyltransferase P-like n=1 Tax=Eriocheir sinensis TaxID=95602 RepID=UPI0021C65291|nr:galactosylgalactosylxylosylprotein 3-beta-glucuronosyltransferase P-like [Eriocheir sinensis]
MASGLRAVVGVGAVGGLLVVLLWSEQQASTRTPAQARGGVLEESQGFRVVKERLTAPVKAIINNIRSNNHNNHNNNHHHHHLNATASPRRSPAAAAAPLLSVSSPLLSSSKTIIYVITPTYRRPEQVAELTRLAQTLMLVPDLHWLVVEDAVSPTRRVLAFLDSCSVPHTYLLGTASRRYKGANKPRGVSNRNAGLKWLKVHAKDGVIYFADDDNTYDYRIFDEIRLTRQVSMFPVGLVTRFGVSTPIVSSGKLVGFYDGWIAGRRFPVDMAGFAVNVQFYLQRNAPLMPYSVGFEEDGFLKALKIKPEDIEPLAENCTKILVWHTRTVKTQPAARMPDTDKVTKTNLHHLKSQIVFPSGLS